MRLKYRDLVRFYHILLFSPLFCSDSKLRLGSKIFQIEDRKLKIILKRPGKTECILMCLIKVNIWDVNITIASLLKENLIINIYIENILSAYLLHFVIFSWYFQKGRCGKNYFLNTFSSQWMGDKVFLTNYWKYSKLNISKIFLTIFLDDHWIKTFKFDPSLIVFSLVTFYH